MATEFEVLPFDDMTDVDDTPNGPEHSPNNLVSRTISGTTYQVYAAWDHNHKMVICVRTLPLGRWTVYVQSGITWSGVDNHESISLGIDADGILHVCYDMHAEALKYAKSNAALSSWTGTLTTGLSMLGTNESEVSYPTFFVSPTGVLYFLFRDGSSSSSDWFMYTYSTGTDTWGASAGTGSGGKLLNGKGSSPAEGTYILGTPAFSSDWNGSGTGYMHLMFHFRLSTDSHDLCHVRWDATNWTKLSGSSQTVPITHENADIVNAIATTEDFHCNIAAGLALDSDNRPHAAYIKNDVSSDPQAHHIWYNGSSWVEVKVTSFSGATREGWALPTILIDTAENIVYLLFACTATTDGIKQAASDPGDYTTWTTTTFYDDDVSVFGVKPDVRAWLEDGDISFVVGWRDLLSATRPNARLKFISRQPDDAETAFSTTVWTRKHPITIDDAKVGSGGVSNFMTLLTRVNFADEVFSPSDSNKAQADGGDLRFFSDSALTTQLPAYVERFSRDSSHGADDGVAEIYVKVTSIAGTGSGDTTIWVAYHTATPVWAPWAEDTYGQFAAHPSHCLYHWTLSRTKGSGAKDNNRQARVVGTPAVAAGMVGDGLDLNGTTDSIDCGTGTVGIPNAFTVIASVNMDNAGGVGLIVDTDHVNTKRNFQFRKEDAGELRGLRWDSADNLVVDITGTTNLRTSGHTRVAFKSDETNGAKIYVDGAGEGTDPSTDAINDVSDASLRLGINGRSETALMAGILDAVELHDSYLSDAWILTDFNNRSDPATFATAGTPQDTAGFSGARQQSIGTDLFGGGLRLAG